MSALISSAVDGPAARGDPTLLRSRPALQPGRARPSTSTSRTRSAAVRPTLARCPGRESRQTARRALGLCLDDPPPAAWARGCCCRVCGGGSSPGRRRRRRSDAGRTLRSRSEPGGLPRTPERWSSVDSVRSRRPSMPYMICSGAVFGRLDVRDELHELGLASSSRLR